MLKEWKQIVSVQKGGKVEISLPALPEGAQVDILVRQRPGRLAQRKGRAPGHDGAISLAKLRRNLDQLASGLENIPALADEVFTREGSQGEHD